MVEWNDRRVSLANKKGERSVALGRHQIGRIPVEKIKGNMWVRPSHNPHVPFLRTKGPAMEEPREHRDPVNLSGDEELDDWSLYTVGYHGGRIDPHAPEGHTYHVLFRDRRRAAPGTVSRQSGR
jgi:hypothetical protein